MKRPRHKIPVLVRTYRIDGSGGRILEREELLRDDPRNGVCDLTRWHRKYAPFEGNHASRKRYPSRHREEGRSVWYARRPGGGPHTPFPPMTDVERMEFDDFFTSQRGLYLDFIDNKILEGELRDDLGLDALEAMCDGVRAAYLKYDPERPARRRPEGGGKPRPASRETFCARVARNALSDFIDITNAGKRGLRARHLSVSEKPRGDVGAGEVSAECLADDRRDPIRDMAFRIDVEILRDRLPPNLRAVLDMLLEEWPHYLIRQRLGVSNDRYERRCLGPIQNLAADLGFEPSDDDAFIDRMYAFRRKARGMKRGRELRTGR